MTKYIWLLLIFIPLRNAVAQPIVPQFRSGTLSTQSSSETLINETISSYQYSGATWSANGTNVKPIDGSAVNPATTLTASQSTGGVVYKWTTPDINSIPRFEIVNEAEPFSLTTYSKNSGLDTITIIQRQIQTSTQSSSESVFGM